ncbi:hypothetical protein WJX72_001754 [[Myrmecia] bisecta]|uniref:F-box domain-containing protein n=1 Tax=[Myrmecia] bisecta TaxID=41462 RepID=A0AAW1QP52_9CHLO
MQDPQTSKVVRALFAASCKKAAPPRVIRPASYIDDLPDEILLKVFADLARVGPVVPPQVEALQGARMPFRTLDNPGEPHPGLRSYPFLGQVCKRWNKILCDPASREVLWQSVVVDFGHELITAVHTPIVWSNRRPTDDEFRESFSVTRLSAQRILAFIRQQQKAIRRVVLMNSEGYWSDEGDFVNLQNKHNFAMAHFGMLLGLLQDSLEELQVQHCNDFFSYGQGGFGAISCLHNLRKLSVEDLHCRVEKESTAELSRLVQLEELCISGEEHAGAWAVGIDVIPKAWINLKHLRKLELRGHTMLAMLPPVLADMQLTHLDVSLCRNADLSVISSMRTLQVLALQGLDLAENGSGAPAPNVPTRRTLPCLTQLTSLTALNLCDNYFTRVPTALSMLQRLQFLDMSNNPELQVPSPLSMLTSLPQLRTVDLRGIHQEPTLGYWSDVKCTTMRYVAAFTKAMKRRPYPTRVLVEVD